MLRLVYWRTTLHAVLCCCHGPKGEREELHEAPQALNLFLDFPTVPRPSPPHVPSMGLPCNEAAQTEPSCITAPSAALLASSPEGPHAGLNFPDPRPPHLLQHGPTAPGPASSSLPPAAPPLTPHLLQAH